MTIYCIFFILAGIYQLEALKDDKTCYQLPMFAKNHPESPLLTSDTGCPQDSATTVPTVGKCGTMIPDVFFMQQMNRFYRERIPERSLHAKGAGAFGYFEVTNDLAKYTKAKLFEKAGKKTPVVVRFSGGVGEQGTADTTRDIQGFAIKFYTSEGNWDIVGANYPVFHIRDPSLIVHYAHALKRNPKTSVPDWNARWDFFTSRPETCHAVMFRFGDRGIPDGYRHMDGFAIHAYKLVNDKNEVYYCKFTIKTDQGIKSLNSERATYIGGKDPDYFIRDLYNAIEKKEYPSWSVYIQLMSAEEAEKYHCNVFDPTKVWLHKDYPLIPVGKLVLDRNPINHFAEVEQLAFCPGNLVPGIEPSLDRLLQGRMITYSQAHMHRMGPNYNQLPVNYPHKGMEVKNYNRDGCCAYFNQDGHPNYETERYHSPQPVLSAAYSEYYVNGTVKRYDLRDEDNFSQPRLFWNNVLKPEEKERLVENICETLKCVEPPMQEKVLKYFHFVSPEMSDSMAAKMESKT